MKNALVILVLVGVVVVVVVVVYSNSIARSRSQKFRIFDITGVEDDECAGHAPDIKLVKDRRFLKRCSTVLFEEDSNRHPHLVEKIKNHNSGEICLSGCFLHWKDRIKKLLHLLKKIDTMCKKLKLQWVIYYGALLGWHRNGALLPWDPDIDILMPRNAFYPRESEEQVIYEDKNLIFKLNGPDNKIMGVITDKETFLYCDVFYWTESDNSVQISRIPSNSPSYLDIPRDKFFPLQYIYLNNIKIQAPLDIKYNLEQRYGNIDFIPYKLKKGNYYINEK